MIRVGILLALGLLATGDAVAAGSQRTNATEPPRYSEASSGWWNSFRPVPKKPPVKAPAAGEQLNAAEAIAEPAAAEPQPRARVSKTPVQADVTPTQNITKQQSEAATASPQQKSTASPRQQKSTASPRQQKSTTAPTQRKATKSSSRKKVAKARRSKVARTKKRTRTTVAATKPKESAQIAEARWWEETGNPPVFAFAGCVSDYAEAAVGTGTELPHTEYLSQAMAGPCKEPFDTMAQTILDRFGEEGFEKVSKELIGTTFLPSVKVSVDKATAEIRAREKQAAALSDELRQAKDAMFSCFVRETDRLAAVSADAPQAVAEAVIAACDAEADRFFVKLDQIYPDLSASDRSAQHIALTGSYLPAILTRVASIRAAARAPQ